MDPFNHTLSRRPAVLKATGDSATRLRFKIDAGLFPRPVKLSSTGRAVAWPVHDVEAVIKARIAGHDDKQVHALVEKLHAARSTLSQAL